MGCCGPWVQATGVLLFRSKGKITPKLWVKSRTIGSWSPRHLLPCRLEYIHYIQKHMQSGPGKLCTICTYMMRLEEIIYKRNTGKRPLPARVPVHDTGQVIPPNCICGRHLKIFTSGEKWDRMSHLTSFPSPVLESPLFLAHTLRGSCLTVAGLQVYMS